ncbi:hypothetical protein Tco_0746494 [Tanacetum coccineum]
MKRSSAVNDLASGTWRLRRLLRNCGKFRVYVLVERGGGGWCSDDVGQRCGFSGVLIVRVSMGALSSRGPISKFEGSCSLPKLFDSGIMDS